jgi:alkaline phosphatase
MGPQAIGLLTAYARYAKHAPERHTNLDRLLEDGEIGLVHHEAFQVLVTDSAASATQMASGKWALSETIGLDTEGEPTVTMLNIAQKMGKSVGLVTDTRITHATPAAFAAHQPHRSRENAIAADLLDSRVDVMLAGGLRHWLPKTVNLADSQTRQTYSQKIGGHIELVSKREDDRDMLAEAEQVGYQTVFTRQQLEQVTSAPVLGLFSDSGLPYRVDLQSALRDPDREIPTLAEMTERALDVLGQDEDGFFLMVESGMIDWAGHDNDAGALLHEMLRFDETLGVILKWLESRHDTLLLVTADHETGGFGFSYSRRELPEGRPMPGALFANETFKPNFNFGSHAILDKLYDQRMSYTRIFQLFDALSEEKRAKETAPAELKRIVDANTSFPISIEQAGQILKTETNRWRVPSHKYLDAEKFPNVDDFEEFYVYGADVRRSNLGRAVAGQQNTVWSTGTHTSTPVVAIAWGPDQITRPFGRLMHTTEWAKLALAVLTAQ